MADEKFVAIIRENELNGDLLDDKPLLREIMYAVWLSAVRDNEGIPVSGKDELVVSRIENLLSTNENIIRATGWARRKLWLAKFKT
jgi:hypothetical protein